MMKIALVALPNPVLFFPEAHFPQGLLYVGGSLKRAGHEVQIVDLRAKKDVVDTDIPEADVIGVTATSGEFHWAKKVAEIATRKRALVMIGGAHATFMPHECTLFDFVIVGDGEDVVVEALATCNSAYLSRPLKTLAGYFPDWSLIGERGLSRELFTGAGYGKGPLAAGALSSRGCSHNCSYCRSVRDRVRLRPIADVVAEIEMLKSEYGVSHFRFYDENFTNPKSRALELCEALAPLGIHIRAHTRGDAWDDERAVAFKKAGGEEMGLGFEAASDHVLAAVRKGETVAQHREAVRACKRHGIVCKAFWMVGLSQQRWAEIDDIKGFMLDERPDKWIVSLFCPYPGSDVWAHPERYGVSFIEPDLSRYWNFPSRPCVGYKDNPPKQIWQQYLDLVSWLEKHYGRG